jgi:SAM-dependent methyltransferase
MPGMPPDYVLGHDDAELDRLVKQSEFFGVLTEHVLRQAGLAPGMTVLDVGCGAGDVSLLAARIVGSGGRVIGVDRSSDAVALGTKRAAAAGVGNLELRCADVGALVLDAPVDALIGRLVLMYFPDPAAVLRRLVELVVPGGLIAFHEIYVLGATSRPACPLFDLGIRRIHDTFTRAGADPMLGIKLADVFIDAGLPPPAMLLGARIEYGAASPAYDMLTGITRTLLPIMASTGVATASEVDIDTLSARLRAEAVANRATLVAPPLVGAWARRAP